MLFLRQRLVKVCTEYQPIRDKYCLCSDQSEISIYLKTGDDSTDTTLCSVASMIWTMVMSLVNTIMSVSLSELKSPNAAGVKDSLLSPNTASEMLRRSLHSTIVKNSH